MAQRGKCDSGNGDLATTGGRRFCTVKRSTVRAYREALGAGREAGDNYGLEREGLEKEVLYLPKRHRFDAENK